MKKANKRLNAEKIQENCKFIIYFLYEDENQGVHVEEVEEIDFFKVIYHLNLGGSVFITQRR
jgi:hypothetical protein